MEWGNGKLFTFRLALVDYITMVNTEFEFGRRDLFTKFTDRKIVLTA